MDSLIAPTQEALPALPGPPPFAGRLAALAALQPRLARQKVIDAADLADPRLDFVIRACLGRTPQIRPRLWEGARVYDLLAQLGALGPGRQGLSFGSGREVVLYAIANSCERLTATDLYSAGTDWANARTADPATFVLTDPPMPVDPARLAVRSMDAREIAFPDASFDFAYSVSSFEHFGREEDMVRHLAEVARVLRPGGVYVMTTEVRFAAASRRTLGNYAFALPDLFAMFDQAGMQAEAEVDMRQADWQENEARPPAGLLNFGPAAELAESFAVRDLAGDASAAVTFVLRPGQGARPVAIGLEDAILRQAERHRRATMRRWRDWVRLNPFGHAAAGRSAFCDLFVDPAAPQPAQGLVFGTAYADLGAGPAEARVVVVPSPADVSDGVVELLLLQRMRDGGEGSVLERRRLRLGPGAPIAHDCRFSFDAAADAAYAIHGRKPNGGGKVVIGTVDVLMRHRHRA